MFFNFSYKLPGVGLEGVDGVSFDDWYRALDFARDTCRKNGGELVRLELSDWGEFEFIK